MLKIRKDDTVYVIAGKDKGKTGKVIKTLSARGSVLVEGVNRIKKHMRRTKEDQKGGVIEIESPIDISNLKIFCKSCSKPTRIGVIIKQDKASKGTIKNKIRICKRCNEAV